MTVWKERVTLVVVILSLILSTYSVYTLRVMQHKYVNIQYGYSIYETETGFQTQYSFSNRGNIPATDVRIMLTYPAGTEIQKITPTVEYTDSENDLAKLVEIEIQRLDLHTQLSLLVASSHEPTEPPKVLYNGDVEAEG